MFKLKSNRLEDFPFKAYANASAEELEALAKEHFLVSHNSWMLPQISAHYGNWELVWKDGLIDPKATARLNAGSDEWELGLWKVVTKLRRGLLVKSQITDSTYSALSPIILAGIKKFQGVPFSKWNLEPGCPLVDESLLEAMLFRDDNLFTVEDSDATASDKVAPDKVVPDKVAPDKARCNLGSSRLLEIRNIGLTTKTGVRAGTVSKPTSSWCLKGIKGTELGHVPKLVGTMLTQIWVAHPSLRNQYLVLDPYNWDDIPAPLVSTEIFLPEYASAPPVDTKPNELPW